ncbi:MAG: prepilin-type N-terminal cleavage/methylation domain-containing protein [bacterium]
MRKKAFSLVELMVSISIIVIFSSFFIAYSFENKSCVVASELEKLFLTFSYLQQKAMASGQEQELFFDCNCNEYYYGMPNGKRCTTKLHSFVMFGFFRGSKGPPGKAVNEICTPVTFPLKNNILTATFFPDGKISPGTVYLIDRNKKEMRALTSPIAPVFNLRKYRYDKEKWVQ